MLENTHIGDRFYGDILLAIDDKVISMEESGLHIISTTNIHAASPKERSILSYATISGEQVSDYVSKQTLNPARENITSQVKQAFDYTLEFILFSDNLNQTGGQYLDINLSDLLHTLLKGGKITRLSDESIKEFNGIEDAESIDIIDLIGGTVMKGYYLSHEITEYNRRKYDNVRDCFKMTITFRVPKPNLCNFALSQNVLIDEYGNYEEFRISPTFAIDRYPNLPTIGGWNESDVFIINEDKVISFRLSGLHLISQDSILNTKRKQRESLSYVELDGEQTGNINYNYEPFDYSLEFMMFSDNIDTLEDTEKGLNISNRISQMLTGGKTYQEIDFNGLENKKEVHIYNFFSGQKIIGYYKSIEETNNGRLQYDNIKDYKTYKITFRVIKPQDCEFYLNNDYLLELNERVGEQGVNYLINS